MSDYTNRHWHTSLTAKVPLANKRRFGLPEEAPLPSSGPPSNYSRPPASDIEYFNGRIVRERVEDRKPEIPRDSKWDRVDDYPKREEERDDRGRDSKRRWDDGGSKAVVEFKDAPADRQLNSNSLLSGFANDAVEGPRKRRSRWGDSTNKADTSALPVSITGNVSQQELDNYATHVRLEEINRKLKSGDVVPPPGQRSPSPPPQYDAYGRRSNTLELRYRQKLEDERTRLIDRAMKSDPNFRPPTEYGGVNRQHWGKPQEKVYIPVKEFPEINFFGLLCGPRGNTLKKMERESGAKISIRGKGSVKEGKSRSEKFAGDEEDELHCLITAELDSHVRACVKMINTVIETAASTPEGQNDHKRNQLRELASLNGTLRDDENQLCQNCGEKGHRRWECPQQRVYSANIICRLCGGAGHMARDCRGRGDPNLAQNKQTQFDSEYSALMAELGEGGASATPQGAIQNQQMQQQRLPPWRIPENWQSNYQGGGYRPAQPHHFHQNQIFQQGGAGYGYGAPGGDAGVPDGGASDPYASYVGP